MLPNGKIAGSPRRRSAPWYSWVVKTVIELDEVLARKARLEARRRGLSLEELAEVALAHEVERASRTGFVTTGEGGLVPGVSLEDRDQLADFIGPP